MIMSVHAGEHKTSVSKDLVARVSQCVALGIVDTTQNLGGIAHIHASNDHERIIDALIMELISKNGEPWNYKMAITGGVDTFVPGYGFVHGRANADRILDYLIKNDMEGAIAERDIYADYTRQLFAYVTRRNLEIKRVE